MNSSDILNLFSSQTIGTSSIPLVLFSVVLAFAVGLGIAAVYRMNFRGVMYSSNFTLTLVLMTLITTPVVMCIRESIQLSMGMVGALSIVRFRTAIKEPMDIAFLFWAIAVGIVLAAGLIPLAVFGSIGIGAVLYAFAKKKTVDSPYILVLHCENGETEERARAFVQSQVKRLNLKSKSVDAGRIELNYEVRLREDSSAFVNELEAMAGVSRVELVSYNGDYMG